jgi:hypothetical protein
MDRRSVRPTSDWTYVDPREVGDNALYWVEDEEEELAFPLLDDIEGLISTPHHSSQYRLSPQDELPPTPPPRSPQVRRHNGRSSNDELPPPPPPPRRQTSDPTLTYMRDPHFLRRWSEEVELATSPTRPEADALALIATLSLQQTPPMLRASPMSPRKAPASRSASPVSKVDLALMTHTERMAIMDLVRSKEMSVNQAAHHVKMLSATRTVFGTQTRDEATATAEIANEIMQDTCYSIG